MEPDDLARAEAVWDEAHRTLLVENHLPTLERTPAFVERRRRRFAPLLSTDPGGSWVATEDGIVVGVAQAHVPGDRWVLATLGVRPGRQEGGLGRALLERTLRVGRSAALGAIFSSPDPRAVHRYASAGFDLHPTAVGYGPARKQVASPDGVALGSAADLGLVDAVDRAARGSIRTEDVAFQLDDGCELLFDDDRGYVLVRGGMVLSLAAVDEGTARRLLSAAVARCPTGESVNVSWITARQQWAVQVLVAACVSLYVHEGVMTRGPWEPDRPYLPSGIFG